MSDTSPVSQRIHHARLDALRFYAVAAVLFSHYFPTALTKHIFAGTAGVELFFVISGFLITDILFGYRASSAGTMRNLGKFYARRTLRIFPIYYLYLLVAGLSFPAIGFDELRWALAYVYNFFEMTHTASMPFMHLWSLSIEEQFYLIWPLLILKTSVRRVGAVMLALVLFSVIFRISVPAIHHKLSTLSSFDAFGLGGIFAYLRRYDASRLNAILRRPWMLWLALGWFAAIVCLSFVGSDVLDVGFRTAVAIISFYLLGCCVASEGRVLRRTSWWLDGRKRQYLGMISYGIYLFHLLPMHWMEDLIEQLLRPLAASTSFSLLYFNRYIIGAPIFAGATIILAIFSHRTVERYFSTLKDRLFTR